MTLEEIKDQVAKEKGWINWDELSILVPNHRESVYWPEVCRRAQLECGRLTLEKAAAGIDFDNSEGLILELITDPSNIVLLK